MKKIVIVTRCMHAGGAERVISQLINYGVSLYDISLIILENQYSIDYEIPKECDVIIIKNEKKSLVGKKVSGYLQVRKYVKSINPDVVLSMPEDIGIYVIAALMGTKYPVIVSERNDPQVMPYKKTTRMLRKMVYPFAKGFVFQTNLAASFFSKKIQNKSIVLSNPLELSRLPSPYLGEREKLIVGAGRLETQKNFPLLIDAFAEFYKSHNDYKLIIYGEGRLKRYLEEYALLKLPNTAFTFAGRVDNLPVCINKATVFVLSSNFEGMPNVLIEAMACGVPSISTDCPSGGSADLIVDNVNGFLTAVGDSEAITNRMKYIIENENIVKEMSEKAVLIRERLDSNIVSKQWFEYLDRNSRRSH